MKVKIEDCYPLEEVEEDSLIDQRISENEYLNTNYMISEFIKTLKHDWLREVLRFIIFSGVAKVKACEAVGISPVRFYQVVNKNRAYMAGLKSLKEKWKYFLEHNSKVIC